MPPHPSDNATIVACATGAGAAHQPRALVRLSGPACTKIEKQLLARPAPGATRSPLTARLRLAGSLELPCLAWAATAPRTYTGEDTLELLIPGNPHLVCRVIDRLCSATPGVRPAEPGEFSARAYLNGKLTLEQAEGVAAMVAAGHADELTAAAAVMSGSAGTLYRAWAEEAATLLALVEAGIDFSDQEGVVAIEPRVLRERVERLANAIASRLGNAAGRETQRNRPRVALVGAPNAGKSTLFNALLGRTRAVASPVAGTTRDVLSEPLTLHTGREPVEIDLLDLPGLDADATGIDTLGQTAARAALAEATVHIQCCEAGRFEDLPHAPTRTRAVRVRTKADRPGWVEGAEVAVCALTGAGLDQLRRLIAGAAGSGGNQRGSVVVARHARALQAARESLNRVNADEPAELTAHHLRAALDSLGEISGAVPPDEVIGRVFASFCIGK